MTLQYCMNRSVALARGLCAALALTTSAAWADDDASGESVRGLWAYTGLTSSRGVDMPLSGIFLFAEDGSFLQQAVFNSEPRIRQQAMAHTGTYRAGEGGIQLAADQTLSLAPGAETALTDAGATQHQLDVSREGSALTLVFGSGTVQTLERLGDDGNTRVYPLANGMLAFSGDHFILVNGDGQAAVTGYGRYRKEGEHLWLQAARWSEAANGLAQTLHDVTLAARFDGTTLELADGRRFAVTQ